ncbi:MAG: HDOD domain-containing protein [Thiobacillaceae bacterium]|nr:HDOD domain-containing protein [Thiobacillaceae bacterium]MDW8322685.1 HDOD domain-containing protein [Burkholderiales bacterium]
MTPQELVHEVGALFSLPEVALRLNERLRDPEVSPGELAHIIQLDPGLAAAVLRLANSAYYGLATKVGSIPRAVTLIGLRGLHALSLSVCVTRSFKGLPPELIDMNAFWQHSVSCAVLARALALRSGRVEADLLFLAGLLHAVGRLVFIARRPVHYREVLRLGLTGEALAAQERERFGFDHAELGAALLEAWRLPPALVSAVAWQFRPEDAPAHELEAHLLALARELASSRQTDAEAARLLRLGLNAANLPTLRRTALAQVDELVRILRSEPA